MKSIHFLFLSLSILLFLPACQKDLLTDSGELICKGDHTPCDLVTANNEFGLKVLKKLNETDSAENIFISPTSIASALTMALNGAANQTLADMMTALELEGWTMEEINAAYKTLLQLYPTLDEQVQLKIANSIWYEENQQVLDAFLDVNTETFNSQVEALDFRDPASVHTINDWVSSKTNGLIEEVLSSIPADVVMILINAIYFNGNWRHAFPPQATAQRSFYLEDGTTVSIPMMYHREITLAYTHTEKFQALWRFHILHDGYPSQHGLYCT